MKKITFILFALIAGTTFAQDASAEANAAADIVSPIKIAPAQDLNFGKVSNDAAGTVVVAADGTFDTSSLSQIGSTSPSAAIFNVTAANTFNYTIALPTTITISNGTENITVNNFISDASTQGTGTVEAVGVGATLNVAAEQATGNYTGAFEVTVSYE